MENLGSFLIFIALIYIFYLMLRAPEKIKKSNDHAKAKLLNFEKSLSRPITEYKAYSIGHPYTWVEIRYENFFKSITTSASFSRFPPYWDKAHTFCTKVDEDNKRIYLIPRHTKYDWERLMHYDEWIESNREVAENIAIYQNKNSQI